MEYLFEHQRIANPDCYHAHRYHLLLLLPTENPTLTDDLIPKDKTHALGDGVAVRVEQLAKRGSFGGEQGGCKGGSNFSGLLASLMIMMEILRGVENGDFIIEQRRPSFTVERWVILPSLILPLKLSYCPVVFTLRCFSRL